MGRLIHLLAGFSLIAASPAIAQQIPGPYGEPVSLADARKLLSIAECAATARGLRIAVTVVNTAGEPILLSVMDGTQAASAALSQQKARTAARFRRPTKVFADSVASGDLGLLSVDGIIAADGGLPIVRNGRVIGGIGISGGKSSDDGEIAMAALAKTGLNAVPAAATPAQAVPARQASSAAAGSSC